MDVQAFKDIPACTSHYDAMPAKPNGAEAGAHDTQLGLLQSLAECVEDLVLLLDPDQRILHALGPALRILGLPNPALTGKTLSQIAGPCGDQAAYVSARILSSRRPDGDMVLLEARFGRSPPGVPGVTICTLREVTAQVRLHEHLARLQKLEPIGRLTAGIAHDFNNLLQTMMGSLELLLDEIGDRPEARENAESALRMGERGARLTHHLMAFMRRQVPRTTALALAPLAEEVAHTLRRTLGPRIEVVTHIDPESPPVHADAGQTEAALLNLALNARSAMPQGGTLTIEVALCPGSCGSREPEAGSVEHVLLAVSDSGLGMSRDVLDRACEPFFSTKGSEGTGLGLSMVQTFAQQSGGELRLSSTPGAGTRVEIRLPVAHEQVSAPAIANPGPRAGRVLLVDDEPEVLVTFSLFLRGAGFTVRTARGGEEALAALSSDGAFDVMVTDYAMPGLEGEALIGHVRAIAPDLPILVVSGYAEAERLVDVVRRLRVLRKPFRRLALVQEVAALVDRSGATAPG